MALTRRQFITRTGLAAAGSFLGPSFFRNPFLRQALADTIGDRYFVVVFLSGGNDGLNTVTPVDNGSSGALRAAYEAARGTGAGGLQLASTDLAATLIGNDPHSATPLALHPGLVGLKALYDTGKVAVVQGCGYTSYNLSHELSRDAWQTGNPLGASGFSGGWMGRYLAANYTSVNIPGVCITNDIAAELAQTTTNVLAIRRLSQFGFPYDSFNPADTAAKRDAFAGVCDQASGSPQATFDYLGAAGTATLVSSESYPPISQTYTHDRPSFNAAYGNLKTSLASDLREVAKIIYAVKNGVPNVNARFFEVQNGGYDTHSDQGGGESTGQHYKLHREVGDAIQTFYSDCADMGVANKLCIVTWSEFSRRIGQNANGTDHGSQGPMFVIGGTVHSGIYGNHPNINAAALGSDGNTAYSQAAGDAYRSTDFRDVYGTLMKHWLNMPAGQVSSILPIDGGSSSSYWTAPNFDLGFI
jgi:uncharacterized protein (DUF1501 family)